MTRRTRLWLAALLAAAHGSAAQAFSQPPVEAEHGMVVSSQRLASQIGADILSHGGNAIDAAVAVGYAQAVVNPCCGNIGGGGFMVIHLASGRNLSINFRETAPAAATATLYLDAAGTIVKGASLAGYKAVAVPGTVLGLDTALAQYGTLSRAQVMAPAIKLAREGFVLSRGDTDIIDAGMRRLRADPGAAKLFRRPDGTALQPGDRQLQPELADTLDAIAQEGPDAFYRGRIAKAVVAASQAGGGILTEDDFAHYTVTQDEPVSCAYRGYEFLSAPPPSAGGVAICEILTVLQGYDMKALGFHSAQAIHLMAEAMRSAYRDRNTLLGDPAFVRNPVERLLSPDYAAAIRARIQAARATPSAPAPPGELPHEHSETTHYSVVDGAGNAVSVTYTLNGLFGAGVIAPGTGVLLNDEMDDFTIKPGAPNQFRLVQGPVNGIEPGKRPLSSMAPALVMKDGVVFLVLGSPGGPRIISTVLEVMMNIIDYGMQPQEAVDAPRIHHQWLPDEILAEPFALSPDTVRLLQAQGYTVTEQAPWGAAELIMIPGRASGSAPSSGENDSTVGGALRSGFRYGANDDRRPAGAAVGN